MRLNNTTPVPNLFFDTQIKDLSGSAIRIYLKIIRNLLGWRDENGNVKQKDWIAHSQFEKTGLSNRSVTNGIQELLDQKLIQVTDYLNNDLTDPFKRKKAKRVYYSLILENMEKTALYNEKTKEKSTNFMRSTKEISLPKYSANERIPDQIRMEQIRQEEQRKQIQRDSWV
jgi:Mn-dependent DtxR family transcriptional regulator